MAYFFQFIIVKFVEVFKKCFFKKEFFSVLLRIEKFKNESLEKENFKQLFFINHKIQLKMKQTFRLFLVALFAGAITLGRLQIFRRKGNFSFDPQQNSNFIPTNFSATSGGN